MANRQRQDRTDIALAFGRVIRKYRQERGISQEVLACAVGIDRTYPSLMERGLRCPTLVIIVGLAERFRCCPSKLVKDSVREARALRKAKAAA